MVEAAAAQSSTTDAVENSAEFQALMVSLAGRPERVMGESVIPAEAPDWAVVRRQAQSLIDSGPAHLAVYSVMVRALAHLQGFAGLRNALQDLQQCLETQWDSIHPHADRDDPDDPWYSRVNVLRELAEQPIFLEELYRLPVADVRGVGTFSTRDIDIALGVLAASDEEQERCRENLIRGALRETSAEAILSMDEAIAQARKFCLDIQRLFDERSGTTGDVSFVLLEERLALCGQRLADMAGDALSNARQTTEAASATVAALDVPGGSRGAGLAPVESGEAVQSTSALKDRQSCIETLDAVIAYYRSCEPSSPVMLLAERARSLIGLGFFEVLDVLAPGRSSFEEQLAELSNGPLNGLMTDCFARYRGNPSVADAGEHVHASPATQEGSDAPVSTGGLAQGSRDTGSSGGRVAVESRAQVLASLSDIDAYFREYEPASPIPLVIADIKRLVPRSFVELLADLRVRTTPAEAE